MTYPGSAMVRLFFSLFFPSTTTSSVHLNPSPYCLPALFLSVGTSSMDSATRQLMGTLEPHGGCSNASLHFTPFSFYGLSLLSLVRRMHVGWKMEGKAHESEQQPERAREREMYRTYSTPHEMCNGCLSCDERVAHASRFCSGREHCSPDVA